MSDDNHRIVQTMDDWMRKIERDINRLKRRPNPPDLLEYIGPAVASQAIEVIDWNDETVTYNGWYFSDPPAMNAPVDNQSFIGMSISKDDGSGFQYVFQFVEDPDVDTPELWVRTWVPDDDDGEIPGFSDWFVWGDIFGGGGSAHTWEDGDDYTVTSVDLVNEVAVMDLSYVPRAESLQVAVGGLVQPPSEYTVDYDLAQVTFPLGSFEPVGMELKAQYEWDEEIAYAAIPWSIVNTRTEERQYSSGSDLTSFALPSGAAADDILVYMQLGGFGTSASYAVTDSRFYTIGTATVFGRTCGLYVGYVGSGLSPISMSLRGGNNAYGQFAHGTAMILRSGTSRQLQFRIARSGVGAVVASNSGSTIPAISGAGSGALACAFNVGGLGGGYGIGWGSVGQGYSEQYEHGNYEVNSVGTTTNSSPTGANYPTIGTGGDETCVMVVGVQ